MQIRERVSDRAIQRRRFSLRHHNLRSEMERDASSVHGPCHVMSCHVMSWFRYPRADGPSHPFRTRESTLSPMYERRNVRVLRSVGNHSYFFQPTRSDSRRVNFLAGRQYRNITSYISCLYICVQINELKKIDSFEVRMSNARAIKRKNIPTRRA